MAVLTWPPYVVHKRKALLGIRPDLSQRDKELVARVSSRISRDDTMFEGDVASYFLVGLSGLRAIENALESRSNLSIRTILDLPCGCGRVGRYLSVRFPKAKITACDLMTEGVDFCAERLGMIPFYSQRDFNSLDLGQKYDLIWCGSLVTHLKPEDIEMLLRFFDRHLARAGIVVFTAHGDRVAKRLEDGQDYCIAEVAKRSSLEKYRKDGFVFVAYNGRDPAEQYGFSMTSARWIRSQCAMIPGWREISYQPQGWHDHQDVYAYTRE